MHGWVPILIMIGLGAGFGAFNIGVSHLVGPKKPTPEKLAPYECGMPPVGDARDRHPVKFYLVAMIFLLFDIEVAFLYPFAMALRELRWAGFIQLVVFFAILPPATSTSGAKASSTGATSGVDPLRVCGNTLHARPEGRA